MCFWRKKPVRIIKVAPVDDTMKNWSWQGFFAGRHAFESSSRKFANSSAAKADAQRVGPKGYEIQVQSEPFRDSEMLKVVLYASNAYPAANGKHWRVRVVGTAQITEQVLFNQASFDMTEEQANAYADRLVQARMVKTVVHPSERE